MKNQTHRKSRNLSCLMQAFRLFPALALLLAAPVLQAASITWNTPVTIAGDTDVSTSGSSAYAYNGANSTVSVNGVSFTGENSTTSWGSVSFSGFSGNGGGETTSAYAGSGTPWSNLSSNYKTTLQGGDYSGGGAATVTLNGLTSGHQYLVQNITDGSISSTNITVDATKPTVFYRLAYP